MPTPVIGQPAPDFSLADEAGQLHSLAEFRGKNVVLYFYPQDDTPGCTKEACDFRDREADFSGKNAVIVGVSPDAADSHQRFREKYGLPFLLLADPAKQAVGLYDVWREKSFGGKTFFGVERSTFLIDERGVLRAEFRHVKVDGHVEQMLAALAGPQNGD
jgi:peroxiredoxin Q/BCP